MQKRNLDHDYLHLYGAAAVPDTYMGHAAATPLPSLLSADTAVLPLGSWQTMPRFGIVRGSSCGSMCASVDDCVVTMPLEHEHSITRFISCAGSLPALRLNLSIWGTRRPCHLGKRCPWSMSIPSLVSISCACSLPALRLNMLWRTRRPCRVDEHCASVEDCVVTNIFGERLLYHYFVVSLRSTDSAAQRWILATRRLQLFVLAPGVVC